MDLFYRVDNIVNKILEEYFNNSEYLIEKRYHPSLYNRVIYEIQVDYRFRVYIIFIYVFKSTGPEFDRISVYGTHEDHVKVIRIPETEIKKAKSDQELENILRAQLDGFLEQILKRVKLRDVVKKYIKEKLALAEDDEDIRVKVTDDYERKARVDVDKPFNLKLTVSYKWDKDKKMVGDLKLLSIEIPTDDTLKELIFNAIALYLNQIN